MIMPFLDEIAKWFLTTTGAPRSAHQLDIIGGVEGGHHRKLQIFFTSLFYCYSERSTSIKSRISIGILSSLYSGHSVR